MKAARNGSRVYSGRAFEGLGETPAQFPPSFADIASGADQAGVRVYNERLLLSLVRRFGPLSKIEVARLTGLSVQSTSAIMNRLQADGLLKREAPLRGRVGQPTVPLSLDPDGAFSLGLKIGRRSCDLVLIDFRGAVRRRAHRTYAYPVPEMILDFVRSSLPALVGRLERGATAADRRAWRRFAVPALDLGGGNRRPGRARWPPGATSTPNKRSRRSAPIPSCCATTRLRPVRRSSSSGGAGGIATSSISSSARSSAAGLVLDGALRPGRTGNAGALGSMPVMAKSEGGVAPQLIACASIYQLERRLARAGIDASSIWATPDAWADFGPHLDAWIEEVASALAYASVAAISVIDFEAIRHRRSDAGARARSTDRANGANLRWSRPTRIERRRDRLWRGRRRCARHRRRRPAADQEFRSRPGGSSEGAVSQAG